MAKQKTSFFCRNCGANSVRWIGKCPSCGEWNTYAEEFVDHLHKAKGKADTIIGQDAVRISEVLIDEESRIDTLDAELNRVLGGGLVKGSMVLISGEPGIGKSTLLLQMGLKLHSKKVLYVTGEESQSQIKIRSERIKMQNPELYILSETVTDRIFNQANILEPEIIIIDSIQTVVTTNIESTQGSISQVRECAGEFQRYAKESGICIVLVGHITKDGYIAGPKILEHIVDVVLQFEGDNNNIYRLLRSSKNRFGSTSEFGIYEMTNTGLNEVLNPSSVLLGERNHSLSGVSVCCAIEGQRPFLIEVQALVANAVYGTAQRSSTGYDLRRLHMLLAVLEKRVGYQLANKDVFLNLAGGIKLNDPAIDLSVIASIISSYEDKQIDGKFVFAGEVGLSGEIRAVNRIENRVIEAERLGFEKIYIASGNTKGLAQNKFQIEMIGVSTVFELRDILFNSI